jgi:tetratricopeptide (TPR) repeat protein
MPALRFHPAGANSSRALEAVARIPDIALAEARLSELIARSPSPYDRFMARKALTQNRYWNDRYREAEDLIRERIDHPEGNDPDIAFLDLSRVREMQGRYSEAAAILEGGIFAPGRPFRGTALGYMLGVYIHSRNWHAVRQCALTILAEPSDTYYEASIVNFNSGIAFLMQGRIQETRAELQKDIPASQISQAIIDKTSILLGFALCAEGRHEEAIKHLSGLYKSDGSQRSALEFARAIALVHAIAGQRQEVVEPLRRSATEHPDFAARKALHPDDPAVVEAFEIFAAQYHSDYALVSALLAYARGNDAVAADLLRQSLDNGVDQIYQTLEWPIRRLLEQISGAKTLP